jgi:hypothetical protein
MGKRSKPNYGKSHSGSTGMGMEYSKGKARWMAKQRREEEKRWKSLNGPVEVRQADR